ncbi:MAG: division/cell wall cluster transcriptional repressor MraZ [Bdellovibrionaceae bacterium]|nr:division/cell wall cluster transcriptional repressor MraZ [Pseudobdellovibrionaceae bacterium]
MKSPKGSDSRSSRSASKSDVDRFRGRFEVKLDPKGRLSLPPGLRLSENIVITNHRLNGRNALHGYTLESWQKLESRIERLSPLEASVQAFQRFYISGGQVVELDSQGRVLVPAGLRKFAGLEADVVVVGLGDKFEIWSAEVWNVLFGEMIEVFDQTLARIAVLDEKKGEER